MVQHERVYKRRHPARATPAVPGAGRAHVIGTVFLDLVFSELPVNPRPGTEVRSGGLGISPGGAANVAVALARLGMQVDLTAVFADDAFGRFLWRSLADEGIDLSMSALVGGWNTPVTSSYAVGSERSMVTYEESPPIATASLVAPGYRADAVVVSLAEHTGAELDALHREAALVFADAAWDEHPLGGAELASRLAAIDVFLPNAAEAMALARGSSSLEEAASCLAAMGPLVAAKDGSRGSLACRPGHGAHTRAPALAVAQRDTTGAGDVFDAGFVYATLAQWSLQRRLLFANLCAAESVKLVGGSLAAPCWRDLAAFWLGQKDPEVRRRYRFLDEVMVEARAGRYCRRSFPALTGSGPGGTADAGDQASLPSA
jgi:sugar/nucleoside kinase (ribokinase family)